MTDSAIDEEMELFDKVEQPSGVESQSPEDNADVEKTSESDTDTDFSKAEAEVLADPKLDPEEFVKARSDPAFLKELVEKRAAAGGKPPPSPEVEKKSDKRHGYKRTIERQQERLDALSSENDSLKQQLVDRPAAEKAAGAPDTVEKPAATPPADKPKAEDFEDYGEFVEALTDWKNDLREKVARRIDGEKAGELAARNSLSQQFETARGKHKDFDEVLDGVSDIIFSPLQTGILMDTGQAGEIGYFLGNNQEELERLVKIQNPALFAIEMGKISSQLKAESKTDDEDPELPDEPLPKPMKKNLRGVGNQPTKDAAYWSGVSAAEYEEGRLTGKI